MTAIAISGMGLTGLLRLTWVQDTVSYTHLTLPTTERV